MPHRSKHESPRDVYGLLALEQRLQILHDPYIEIMSDLPEFLGAHAGLQLMYHQMLYQSRVPRHL